MLTLINYLYNNYTQAILKSRQVNNLTPKLAMGLTRKRHLLNNKQHSFKQALPQHLAEQADRAMKDIYMLDTLGLTKPVLEAEIENRMVSKIKTVMNFYLNLIDDYVREPHENPSIGIILCSERNRFEVEYALRGTNKPVGVSEFRLSNQYTFIKHHA